jgi:hypothetical protein
MRAFGLVLLLSAQDQPRLVVTSTFGEDKTVRYTFDPARGLKMADAYDVPDWIDADKLVSIRFPNEPAPSAGPYELILINGDVLIGTISGESDSAVVFQSASGKHSVRMDQVAELRRAGTPRSRIDASRGDVVRLAGGDEDAGRLLRVGPESIRFRSSLIGSERTIALRDVLEARFQPGERYRPLQSSIYVQASLADGSSIKGELLSLDRGRARIQAEMNSLGTLNLGSVLALEFRNGAAVYLSDLDPVEVKESSFLSNKPVRAFRKDLSPGPQEGPILLAGRKFDKGLGVHAQSELTFALDGNFRTFSAVAGLEDSARGGGSVEFVVLGDGKELFRSGLIAGPKWAKTLSAPMGPKEIRLKVKGIQRLVLRVECGPDDDVLDRAAWADAKLIR